MNGISFGNDLLALTFEEPSLGLRDIGGFLDVAEGRGRIWRIELRDKEGQLFALDNSHKCRTARYREGETLRLLWEDLSLPEDKRAVDVEVRITLPEGSNLSFWRIRVKNRSERWGIWIVDFPCIGGIRPEGTKLAYPHFLGRLVDLLDPLPIRMIYPSSSATMQFSTLMDGSRGLYLAAHDPNCFYKEFLYEAEGDKVSYRMRNFPEDMGSPGREFTLPYEAVLGIYEGDWVDAAKIYRDWATKQRWCSRKLSDRDDIPSWFKEISVWFVGGPSERMPELRRFLDVPVAFHWYNWHQIPFDRFYPDYFPPKEGFGEKVEELQRVGIKVMPYINARLWDTASKSWKQENPEPYTTKDPKLEKYIEHWGGQNHSVMCPYTEFWRRKVAQIVSILVERYKVDGVYLDQVASMSPVLCFDTSHGHPAGGGSHWVDGYRRLVEEVKERARRINPQAILTTEDHAEPFLDIFDGFLTCNSVFIAPDLIPMFHLVYSGYMITFGRYDGRGFAMKNAQMFLWGTQLGWFSADVLREETPEGRYLRKLARAFSESRKFLLFGEMVRPPKLEGDNPKLSAVWRDGQRPVRMKAVGCTAWKASDGTLGLAITNCDLNPHTVRYKLDVSDYGFPRPARYIVRKVAGDVEFEEKVYDGGEMTHQIALPEMSVLVLEIRKSAEELSI